MTAKDLYISYFENQTHWPLFYSPGWLSIFDPHWRVLVASDEDVHLFFPFREERRLHFSFIRNPPFTPYHGFISNRKLNDIPLATLNILVGDLLKQLPEADELFLDLHPTFPQINLPVNAIQRNKRTNILTLDSGEEVFKKFKPSLQRQIRKAERQLTFEFSEDIHAFYTIYKRSLEQRKAKPIAALDTLESIWNFCKKEQCGWMLFSRDAEGHIHAVLFVVFDNTTAYYLTGGTDKTFYGSGAMGYLLWLSIKECIRRGIHYFDFEGSEEDSINRFFLSFNPTPKSFIHIEEQQSKLLKWLRNLQRR